MHAVPAKNRFAIYQSTGQMASALFMVFTKSDKEKPNAVKRNVQLFLEEMKNGDWEFLPQHFITSAEKKTGKDELLKFIEDCNKAIKLQP